MRLVHFRSLVNLLAICGAVILAERYPRSLSSLGTRKNISDVVYDRVEGHFVKPELKKPPLPEMRVNTETSKTSHKTQSKVYVTTGANTEDKTTISYQASISGNKRLDSTSSLAVCSPQKYQVHLRNGNCTRLVFTKVCYGQCTSYIYPHRLGFYNAEGTWHRAHVISSCSCCSSLQMSTRRYDVTCSVSDREHKTTKSYYVPLAEKCACRPCSAKRSRS